MAYPDVDLTRPMGVSRICWKFVHAPGGEAIVLVTEMGKASCRTISCPCAQRRERCDDYASRAEHHTKNHVRGWNSARFIYLSGTSPEALLPSCRNEQWQIITQIIAHFLEQSNHTQRFERKKNCSTFLSPTPKPFTISSSSRSSSPPLRPSSTARPPSCTCPSSRPVDPCPCSCPAPPPP